MTDPAGHGQLEVRDDVSIDFRDIYATEAGYVWNCLRRLGVPAQDLEDAVHDTFVVVHRRLRDFDPARPIRPWLGGIAARVASELRRRAHRRREAPTDDAGLQALGLAEKTTEADVDRREAQRLVLEALDVLDEDKRAVFVLHEIEGHAIPALSEALEAPVNTLYSRLRLARAAFTARLQALVEEGSP